MWQCKALPKQERLKEVLIYEKQTGEFVWSENHRFKGKKAGSKDGGYLRIRVDGEHYLAHRLAWCWMTGDLNDKLIAGAGSAIGGAAGGVGLRMGLGIKNPILGLGVDYAGSIGGDLVGQNISDRVLRAKHGGLTPLEQEQMQYQRELEGSIRLQVMQEFGISQQERPAQEY